MEKPPAEWVDVADLVPWAMNPRENDGAPVDAVADSIDRFGFGAPVIARLANREIIAGHTRVKAAQKLGLDRVPVRYLDISETEAHALALADNRVGELAEWDDKRLREVLSDLDAHGTDIGNLGWDEKAVEDLVVGWGSEPTTGDDDVHNAVFPVALPAWALATVLSRATTVVDPFGGSGTTLIACAKLGRVARLIEIDPRYCDVIRRRWTTWAKDNGQDPGPGALDG